MNQKENQTPILIWIEKADHSWLKAEAKKKKISIASILRNLIHHLRKKHEES